MKGGSGERNKRTGGRREEERKWRVRRKLRKGG
jgi:hypothetical protein